MYYLCSENKGADQLRSYWEADLRLCFRVGKNPVFSWRGSIYLADQKPLGKYYKTHHKPVMRFLTVINEPHHEKIFAYAKTKAQISFAVNALISTFVFTIRIV